MRGSRPRCAASSSRSTGRGSSIATSGSSIGIRSCTPQSPISRSTTARPGAASGTFAIRLPTDPDALSSWPRRVRRRCSATPPSPSTPMIADEHADPHTGSGAVKITPAHDFADFEVGRRHALPLINIFDEDARLNDAVPPAYRRLDRFAARDKVLAELAKLGLIDRVVEHTLMVPHGDRSGAVIEPWLTGQWFCDAKA